MKLFCVLLFLVPVFVCAQTPAKAVGVAQAPLPFPAADAGDPDGSLPKVIEKVEALYPVEYTASGRSGFAWVAFVVDKSGQPKQVRAFFGSGERFESAAEAAVRQWKLSPGVHHGRPVMTQMVVRFDFTPGEQSKPDVPAATH